jgi:ABC-type dipeptide/oligopeptide/nickel transport system permease subunit
MSTHASGTTEAVAAPDAPALAERRPEGVVRGMLRHRSARVGFAILGLYLVGTILGPLIFHSNPSNDFNYQSLQDAFLKPSAAHLLGTDSLGRDTLIRLFYGARFTLFIALTAVALGLAIGIPLGATSGYFGGWADILIQRIVDIVLAFPAFILALSLVAVLGPGLRNLIISVGITSFPRFVRMLRGTVLSVREQPFVEAARALGVRSTRIMVRHVIPNSLAPLIVLATLELGTAILTAAGLGFLGVGVQQPTPEWGGMLGASRDYIFSDSLLITFPGLCIFGAVLAFNLVGDGLRDVLDPRLKR